MTTLAAAPRLVKPAARPEGRTGSADDILLWVIADRQAARGLDRNRAGVAIAAWHRMTPPDRRAVGRRLVALGCPRLGPGVTPYARFAAFIADCVNGVALPEEDAGPASTWPAWTDAGRWELGPEAAPSPDDEEPRPTAGPDFEPTPGDDAERLGLQLGLDREDVSPPDRLAPVDAGRFVVGLVAGAREWDRRLDVMFADAVERGRVTDRDMYPHGGVS